MDVIDLLKVSVDRLTFLGGIAGKTSKDSKGGTIYHSLKELEVSPFVKYVGSAQRPYKSSFYMQDGSILQVADATSGIDIAPIRYDFNPNNWDSEFVKDTHLMTVLRCIKNPRLSRLDVAIDVQGVDLGKYNWKDQRSRKMNKWFDGVGNAETIYVGSKDSDERVRIYNKSKERTDKGTVVKHDNWWRVESQVRSDKAEKYLEINPFEDLSCTKDFQFDESGVQLDYDIRTKAMLYYLQQFPNAMLELSESSRSKYKQLLMATQEQVAEISFASIYEQHKEEIHQTIEMYKNLCERSNEWNENVDDVDISMNGVDEVYKELQKKKKITQLEDDHE